MLHEKLDNKAAGKCPHCRHRSAQCRPVTQGWFCRVDGLIEDPSSWLVPSAAPDHIAVTTDPDVIAAWADVENAQFTYDAAAAVWERAVAKMAEAQLQGGGRYVIVDGVLRERQATRHGQRVLDELAKEQADALEAREDAGEALRRAKVRHHQAQETARVAFVAAS